jgi:2-dehydropantoate 2-reductase
MASAASSPSSESPLGSRPRIAVVGVGALGGYYAGKLIHRDQAEVHLLLRSDYDAVRKGGLQIRSYQGDFHLPAERLNAHRDPREVPTPDVVLVALKSTGNDAFDSLIRPLLRNETAILTLQNGLGNEDKLADLFGAQRVMGGMAFVCINRLSPGVIHHIDHGFLKIGEYTPRGERARGSSPRVRQIAELFRAAGVQCDVLEDLRRGRWEKLLWNIPFNGFGAVLDLTTDLLINHEAGMELLVRIMQEVRAIAAADGAELPESLIQTQIERTRTMGAYQSSSQVDRRQGRAMEIEAILGEPLRRAEQLGVPAPTLATLYPMARLIDPVQRVR